MPVTSGVTTCATCQALVSDDEVKGGSVYYCAVCDPHPHYHLACIGGGYDSTCPTCGSTVTLADFDEWGPAQVIDNSKWADEDQPNRQVPDSWEDIVDRPAQQDKDSWEDALYNFLAAPPTASEWEYLGYQNGGHELRWQGESSANFGVGQVDVHFHVHFSGKTYFDQPDWSYGGAWVTGVKKTSIDIQQTPALHATVLPVVQRHWETILMTEKAMQSKKDEGRGSWRRKDDEY